MQTQRPYEKELLLLTTNMAPVLLLLRTTLWVGGCGTTECYCLSPRSMFPYNHSCIFMQLILFTTHIIHVYSIIKVTTFPRIIHVTNTSR